MRYIDTRVPDSPSFAFYGKRTEGLQKCRENSGRGHRYTEKTGTKQKTPRGQNDWSEMQRKRKK